MLRLKAPSLHARVSLPLAAIVLASAGLSAAYALQAIHWSVMTDELQSARLATSIAETLSPLPEIHGERYGPASQLYPLLLAPLFGLLSAPAAVDAAHALNALLLASAAVPAYLLGRAVTASRAGGLAAAALTAFTPWLVLSTTLLTENAAYPAFTWAVLLAHSAIAVPTPGRDAAALAGLALAFLARTQLVLLAAALPLAILLHEVGLAVAKAPRGARLRAVRAGARAAVVSHPLLAAATGIVALLALVAGLGGVFGPYRDVLRSDPLPAGVWRASADHLAYVVVGVGVAPFLLAVAWALTAVRGATREAYAFAVLLLVLVPALVLQASSFDVRFAAGGFVQDRYLAYVAPLLAVGAPAALLARSDRGLRAALVLAVGVAFAAVAALAPFPAVDAIFWAAPASSFQEALGTAADSLVPVGALAVAAVLAALVWRLPGVPALAATCVAVVAFCVTEVVYVFEEVALPVTTQEDTIADAERDWVDDAVPKGASVGLVPYAYLPPDVWWDTELWNERVDRVLELYGPTFVPFPVDRVSLDLETGAVSGMPDGDFLLVALDETRLRLAGTVSVATAPPLTVVRIARPPRAEWSTRGAEADGWTLPGRPVRLRFYDAGRPGRRDVRVVVKAASETAGELPFSLVFPGGERRGRLAADKIVDVDFPVCVPAGGYAEATFITPSGVRIGDGRVVGLHLDRIEATPAGPAC